MVQSRRTAAPALKLEKPLVVSLQKFFFIKVVEINKNVPAKYLKKSFTPYFHRNPRGIRGLLQR
jgi:hypothetical protein